MRRIASLPTALLLAACLTAGPGGCGPEEAAAFNEIDHFGDQTLVPQDHPYGICGATFTSAVDPDLIIEHYQAVLSESGWSVQDPESFPITAEGGDQLGTAIGLSAAKGGISFSLGAELLDGAEPPTFNILVGESGS